MKHRGNEQGYVMVIVLMLIVVITISFAVFMRASISNAKQEQIVDKNNLSVVASEMGLDYYITDILNKEKGIFTDVQLEVRSKVICDEENKPTGCETLDNIEKFAEREYESKFDNLVKLIKNKNNIPKEVIKSGDKTITYKLLKLAITPEDKKVIITLSVAGASTSPMTEKNQKELTAEMIFIIPKVIEVNNDVELPEGSVSITDPKVIFDYFLPENIIKEIPCLGSGACEGNGETYLTSGNLNYKNLNTTENFIWFHKGKIDSKKNMNNMGITLIIESIIADNHIKNITGKLVLLGKENGRGELGFGEIETKDTGRVCVNLDGFSKGDISSISFKGNIIYYSSNKQASWPGKGTGAIRFDGSLVDFVKECTGLQSPNQSNGENIPEFIYDRSKVDVKVDVKYTN